MELTATHVGIDMLIDGKAVANEKKEMLKERISGIISQYGSVPSLRLISVGEDPSSASYIRSKIKYGEKLGAKVELTTLPENSTRKEVIEAALKFSRDKATHGILIEAPLPGGLDHTGIAQFIAPEKDVDCITAVNQGKIALNMESVLPATAASIRTLIELQNLEKGSTVTIINRSPVIGRPLSLMLLNRDYTVNVCHSKTKDIASISRRSDIVVVGVGKAKFLTSEFVDEHSIVIDAGINYSDGSLVGDADFENIKDKVRAITPVPGGVGPVTTACIFENLLVAAESQLKNFGSDEPR